MVATTNFRVDGLIASLAVKAPCRVASIANLTLSGEQTVNGVALVAGNRILVKDQTAGKDNGIYEVETSAWTRAADFDGANDVVRGTLVVVPASAGQDFFYQVTTADPITIDTTAITFALANPVLTEVVTATNVIVASETGTTFFLDLVGGFTSTLPAPAIGLKFRFVVKTAPTTAYIITTNAGANILYGTINEITTTAGISVQAQDTLNFVASVALIGDWVEFESDGTNWYLHGVAQVDNGITVSVT